jgi:hypothetical protein
LYHVVEGGGGGGGGGGRSALDGGGSCDALSGGSAADAGDDVGCFRPVAESVVAREVVDGRCGCCGEKSACMSCWSSVVSFVVPFFAPGASVGLLTRLRLHAGGSDAAICDGGKKAGGSDEDVCDGGGSKRAGESCGIMIGLLLSSMVSSSLSEDGDESMSMGSPCEPISIASW